MQEMAVLGSMFGANQHAGSSKRDLRAEAGDRVTARRECCEKFRQKAVL
jgi:hypothetical protein